MKQLQMLSLFVNISKEIISELDEIDLEYEIRHEQIDFDETGPICSDNQLIEIFNKVVQKNNSELYSLIENICKEYTNYCKKVIEEVDNK